MKIGQMIESKYLKQDDVEGELIVTIAKIGRGNIAQEGKPEELKWMVRFSELPKPMVLNTTNIKLMAKACDSEETDDWIGKEVILWVDENVSFGGELVGGIRVKSAKPAAAPKRAAPAKYLDDLKDDIPI